MIKKIKKILKRNAKIVNAVNTVGLALLAGIAVVELAFLRIKIVFEKLKIITMHNKVASGVVCLVLFMGIVIGGIAFASGSDDYPPTEGEVAANYDSAYLAIPINVISTDPQEEYTPQIADVDVVDSGLSDYEEEDEIIEENMHEPAITEEPEADEYDNEDEPGESDEDDDCDDCVDNNQDDNVIPPPPRQCIWVRVYTQHFFDRGSYQERLIISGQQELWIIEDGWAIGRRFYSLEEANEFLTDAENLTATNPSTGFSIQFENTYETVIVWVPNIITENVFSHERCNDCGAVRGN